jgi:hypothetical protein
MVVPDPDNHDGNCAMNNMSFEDTTTEIAILIDGESRVQMESNARKLGSGELIPSNQNNRI